MGQTGAGAGEGRQHRVPPPQSSPGAAAGTGAFTTRTASLVPAHSPNTPNHPYFCCHKLQSRSPLGEAHGSVSHRSLCTKTSLQEVSCFASLFCLVGTLLLVGTLPMALNLGEKNLWRADPVGQIYPVRSQKAEQAFIFCVSSGQLFLGKLGVKES